jgi:uncharacterized RDD family membrane protein YckC
MSSEYILVINGRPEGPFKVETLKDLNIRSEDFVKTPDMVDYKQAHELPELRALFNFEKQHVIPQYFGSFDQRLLASFIDLLVVSACFVIPALLVVLVVADQTTRLVIALSLLVLIPLANMVYHIVMEYSPKQATYGKQLLKIRVCDLYGERISPNRAIGRNVAKLLSALPFFIGFLYAFFNKRQQCFHDIIAETLVMKDRLI